MIQLLAPEWEKTFFSTASSLFYRKRSHTNIVARLRSARQQLFKAFLLCLSNTPANDGFIAEKVPREKSVIGKRLSVKNFFYGWLLSAFVVKHCSDVYSCLTRFYQSSDSAVQRPLRRQPKVELKKPDQMTQPAFLWITNPWSDHDLPQCSRVFSMCATPTNQPVLPTPCY